MTIPASDQVSEYDDTAQSQHEHDIVDGSDDEDHYADYYDYGDLEETGGSYAVDMGDGRIVSVDEHDAECSCDGTTCTHYLIEI